MGNNIVEENPTQQSSAPSGPQGQGAGGGEEKIRKQARQLAYDVRYKVKQGFKDGQKTDPASLKRAYLAQLGKSPAPGPVKGVAKKMLVGEAYDFTDVSETVSSSVANAIKSIFVENKKACEICGSFDHLTEDCPTTVNEALQEKKYKVRVTDKKTGKSYTRFADRAKISELRKNPNISSVEMTGYGTPYEGEKKKGSATADVKSGKGLAKKDYDGDGKRETPTAEYKGSKDKAIKKALHKEHHQKDANGNTIPHEGVDESVGSAIDKGLGAVGDTAKVAGKAAKGSVKVASKVAKGTGETLATAAGTPVGVAKSVKKGWKAGTASESVEFIGELNTENDNPNANVKKIDTMKGKNKVIINPNMGEQKELEPGKGQPAGVAAPVAPPEPPKEDSKEKRIRMVKRQILQKKMQAVRQGGGIDIVAHTEPEGKVIESVGSAVDKALGAVGDTAKVAGKAAKGSVKVASKVVKGAGEAAAQVAGTPVGVAKSIKKGWKKGTASESIDPMVQSGLDALNMIEGKKEEPPIKDQSDKQIASVTFDGAGDEGGATITGSGDPREIPTFVTLIKQKLRARGILVSHNVPEGEQLDELNKAERVDAGQGKRAAKKGDWSKQKAKTGRRNINRFETKPVEREHGTLDKGKQSYKKVKVLNPKSGYSKKTDATKGKVTSRKLSPTGTDLKPDYGPQKPHWAGNVHSDRAQQQRRSEHKARRGVKTKGTVASDIKKSMKETLDPTVQSALDSLNSIIKKEGLNK